MSGEKIVSSGFSQDGTRMVISYYDPACVRPFVLHQDRWATLGKERKFPGAKFVAVDLSPDGRTVAAVRPDEDRVRLLALPDLVEKPLGIRVPRGSVAPTFSPDGRAVGVLVDKGSGRWEVHAGTPGGTSRMIQRFYGNPPPQILSWSFSADGKTTDIVSHT